MIIPVAQRIQSVQEYYFSKKLAEIRKLRAAGNPIINLGIGSPDMAPSASTIQKLMAETQQPKNHGYQSYQGAPEFRNAIANWTEQAYAVKLDPATEILPLIGSKEGIMHLSMAFLNPGDKVLVPNPGYPTYSAVSRLLGAEVVEYNLTETNNWQIDVDQLQELDLEGVKIMWINPLHMPTGVELSKETMHQLVQLAKKHQFLLASDNPYSLVLTEQPQSILQIDGAKEVAVELNSLSKSHNMAGWRLGWLAGNPEYIQAVLRVKSNMDSGMFLPLQLAAAEALNNSSEWHAERNAVYAERRKKAAAIFNDLNCEIAPRQAGMFVWAKVPESITDVEAYVDELIHKAHVFITPGFVFGSNGSRYLRMSLCNPIEIMEQAHQQLKQV
tara:strand:- start:20523 stop:21680 length:1158 start_codon:yes stop_codon:yes gene_type:complete